MFCLGFVTKCTLSVIWRLDRGQMNRPSRINYLYLWRDRIQIGDEYKKEDINNLNILRVYNHIYHRQ